MAEKLKAKNSLFLKKAAKAAVSYIWRKKNVYIKDFIFNEDGIETMEWLAILVATAVLIGVCAQVAKAIKEKTKNVANNI